MIEFALGHGTGNDFVVLPDAEGILDLTPGRVRALCDRRTGLGADGVLRAVRSAADHDAPSTDAEWFMDYRNADGSLAEMCGNGIRVFARYLVDEGLADPGRIEIATRAGVVAVEVRDRDDIAVEMGRASTPALRAMPQVMVGEHSWEAVGVHVPNPHAVAFVDDLADAGDLREAPEVVPTAVFPEGVNVEFVVVRGPGHVAMRVFERGSGETMSCGTGAVAVAWAARRRLGEDAPEEIVVDVPGGTLRVREDPDGSLTLIGPAVIVARGRLDPQWVGQAWS